jgi:hypothetical protein
VVFITECFGDEIPLFGAKLDDELLDGVVFLCYLDAFSVHSLREKELAGLP